MNSHTLLSIAFTLIVLIALALYWLKTRYRARPVSPTPAAPAGAYAFPAHLAQAEPSSPDPADIDRWEANAHWREDDTHYASNSHLEPHVDELREDLGSELQDASTSFAGEYPEDHAPLASSTASSLPLPSQTDSGLRCPRCRSSRIDSRNRARRAGSTIGSVAGATSAMAIALSGAEAGAVAGSLAGPIGTVFGGLAGAVIAGLVGSAAGCAAGSAVGAAIDDNVLDNHRCLSCDQTFSAARS